MLLRVHSDGCMEKAWEVSEPGCRQITREAVAVDEARNGDVD